MSESANAEPDKKPCKKCKEEIDAKAKECPHCQVKYPHTNNAKGCLVLIFIIIGFLAVLSMFPSGPGGDGPDKKTSTQADPKQEMEKELAEIDSDIIKVDLWNEGDKYRASIFYLEDTAMGPGDYIFMGANSLVEIFEEIYEEYDPETFSGFIIFLKIPTVTNSGEEGEGLAMKLHFDGQRLSGVKWNNITGWNLLNMVEDVERRPVGREILSDFCSKDKNYRYSRSFCNQYAY